MGLDKVWGCSASKNLSQLGSVPARCPVRVLHSHCDVPLLCPTRVKPPFFSLQVFPKKLVAFSTWIDRTRWARNTWAMAAIIIVTMADIVDMVSHGGSAGTCSDLPHPQSP